MLSSPNIIYTIIILFFSIVIHEVAHGFTALKCGDSTALDQGRITLNPLAHIDPMGTIIFPVLLILTRSPILFGWAKPVPINPYNFRDIKKDTIKVGLSGVLANFSLSIIFSLLIWILTILDVHKTPGGIQYVTVLITGVNLNLFLGLFNLIPIPPLDGSRVVASLLPDEFAASYAKLEPYGIFLIILTLNLVWWPLISIISRFILQLLFMGLPV